MNRPRFHIAVRVLAWTTLIGAAALVTRTVPAEEAAEPAVGPAAELTREQQEQFLRSAEVVKIRKAGQGVTGSKRATLSDGTLTHDAHVQTVNERKSKYVTARGTELDFRDFYGFNVAGYRLSKLLGLDIVPATVERKVRRHQASVSWWVDGVMMSGTEFYKGGSKAPKSARIPQQRAQAQVFQQLIYNTDPNLGNVVLDANWKGWIFDFSRAFRRWAKLEQPRFLNRIGRGFLERLRHLDPADVEREVGPLLRPVELKGLLARRELMVRHFDALIAERGEAAVLLEGF